MKMDEAGGRCCAMESPDGIAIPLTGVAVEGTLHGSLLSVCMQQRWTNTNQVPLETLWHVPLPEHAVVRSLEIERGGASRKAIVLKRDEAFNRYEEATEEGWRSALLDAETEGVLSFRLGNLDAGDSILVTLGWVGIVEESAGALRIRIPTAIAPRYFPALPDDGQQVPLEERLSLPWTDRVPYGITVKMAIDDPASVRQVFSPSHPLSLEFSDQRIMVQVGSDDAPMDRDFVLEVAMKEERQPHAWYTHSHGDLWIAADAKLPAPAQLQPRTIAFLLDTSGSMEGESLNAAKKALKACIGALGKADRFGVFAFNSIVHDGQKHVHAADEQSMKAARKWIDRQEAEGGTELLAALEHVWAWGKWTDVLVITDGETGDTDRIAGMASRQKEGGTRLHILGIGSAPAVDAIARIVRAGGGMYGTVHPNDRIEPRTLALFGALLAGTVENIAMMLDGHPCELPAEAAACAGQRLRLFGRLSPAQESPASVQLQAIVAGEPWQCEVPLAQPDASLDAGTIPSLWASEKVAALLDQATMSDTRHKSTQLEQEAADLAVRHGILTPVSSMVLIDDEGEKVGGNVYFKDIPVVLPHGWGGRTAAYCKLYMPRLAVSQDMSQPILREDAAPLHFAAALSDKPGVAPWWDLLALQIPGGGFGPIPELLAFLRLVESSGELAASLAGESLLSALLAGQLAAEKERSLTAALGIAWLESVWGEEAYSWEPLVRESRMLAAESVENGDGTSRAAIEWARSVLAQAGNEAVQRST
ncbi:MAG: VIT and VWA domain-containing protein [Spirochaetaceae bacterium]|nr:VIT and VWA domain-containing protein [Spirochaetaceae bacterium]